MDMRKRILLIVLLFALALAGPVAVLLCRRPPSEATDTPGVDPRRKFIMAARSADGLHWKKDGKVLLRSASTPQVAVVKGEPVILFVRGGRDLESARLLGGTWRARPLAIDGEPTGMCVDPDAVAIPGGWRLYYTWQARQTDPGAGADNEVHSALSTDFLHWKKEEGARFGGKGVVDPDVVRLGRGTRMYFTKDTSSILSAFSADGLTFLEEKGRRIELGCVSCTVRTSRGFRTYFHRFIAGKPAVLACDSRDGVTFADERIVLSAGDGDDREGAESPSVARLADGWLMVYVSYR